MKYGKCKAGLKNYTYFWIPKYRQMLNQKLRQKLLQKLSPQQIQLIKLLELPTLELEQRIRKELEENPILEEGDNDDDFEDSDSKDEGEDSTFDDNDEFSVDDYLNDEDVPSYKLKANNYSKDDKVIDMPYSEGPGLQEHLISQIGMREFTDTEKELAKYLIGNIHDDGYIRREISAIVNDLALTMNIFTDKETLTRILRKIQNFDPPGIAASNLQECLSLQLHYKIEYLGKKDPDLMLAMEITDKYFKEFSKKHYSKIQQRMNISSEQLKCATEEIMKLNPKPGGAFSGSSSINFGQITPDFILKIVEGEAVVSLNSSDAPELRVNGTYESMLKGYKTNKKGMSKMDKNTVGFIKQKLDSAKWFIEAVKQRRNTLLLTINAILGFQKEYFLDGDERKLRPMILKDISEITRLDISTISRVANSKYIQTHFGIYPLKYFFSEAMNTLDGKEVSTREIKLILQECIDSEDKSKPHTDEKLAQILQEKGYRIARRTVAKYREQLDILVARLRKEI